MRWTPGRQGPGYDKFRFFSTRCSDAYLIHFTEGAKVPPHKDLVPGKKHYRLNIVLRKPKSGGELVGGSPIFKSSRITLFRPDINEHAMSKIDEGDCLMLSFGIAV